MFNFETLTKARAAHKNLFWKETYALLILCRNDILNKYPAKFTTFPINILPLILKNNKAINQAWSQTEMINVRKN